MSFIEQSLTPAIFWGALSAVGTLLAIVVALFFPICFQYVKNNQIEKLLEAEIKDNLDKIKDISMKNVTLQGGPMSGQQISAQQRNDLLLPHVKLMLWGQFKYELATNRPKSFKKYNDLNISFELLLDSATTPDVLRLVLQNEISQKIRKDYESIFGNK